MKSPTRKAKNQPNDNIFPPFTDPFKMPFYYASLSSLKVYYRVDSDVLEPFLQGTTLKVAHFADGGSHQGVVSVEFQNYTGHGGTLLETCNEVEFNILSYPASREADVPTMTLEEFVKGQDQTKTIGGLRLYVPADNPFAVKAGREIFGEPKFVTAFHYAVPALNLPDQKTWTYTVLDPSYTPPQDPSKYRPKLTDVIYTLDADLQSFTPDVGNPSPIVLYSMFPQLPNGGLAGRDGYHGERLIGSLWNILGVDQVYVLNKAAQKKVRITFGKSKHPMRTDMQKIIGDAPAVIAQIFQSPPAAVENRAFYVNV